MTMFHYDKKTLKSWEDVDHSGLSSFFKIQQYVKTFDIYNNIIESQTGIPSEYGKINNKMINYEKVESKYIHKYESFTIEMLEDMLFGLSEIKYTINKEIEINNKMNDKLYVRESDVPKTNTRIAFIRKFVESKAPSFSNEACTVLQCEKGRYRSITELHQIVLSRFPKTSFEAILRIVKELIGNESPIVMCYCTTVKKVVLMYATNATKQYISTNSLNNYMDREGVDGYTLRQYLEIINKLN